MPAVGRSKQSTGDREPTVGEAAKQLRKAVVRSVSFRRRPKRETVSLGTQTVPATQTAPATAVDTATDPMDEPPMDGAPPADASQRPGPMVRRVSFTTAMAKMSIGATRRPSIRRGDSVPALPPRASDVREAVSQLTRRNSSQRVSIASSRRPSMGPPRASQVRAAMQPLYGEDAPEPEPTLGLTKAPSQPVALVGVIKRASVAGTAARSARLERRRDRRCARNARHDDDGDDDDVVARPPRASAIARAVEGL